jgi:putative aldouronate transport system substrate-binding protein
MKKKRNKGALLIALIFVLAGCRGAAADQDSTAAASSTQPAPTEQVTETQSQETSMEKVNGTIAGVRNDTYSPWSEMTRIQEMEEEAKDYIELEWTDWPSASVAEKKSLAINSGTYPEVIIGTWSFTTNETTDYAAQGIFLPLEDYITKDIMPNLAAVFEAKPEWKEGLSAHDGHIYALPSLSEYDATVRTINDTVLINTEWLAAVGMDKPTTTEELYTVLKAFKEAGDLNGNGQADEIPMSFCYGTTSYGDHINGIRSMLGWFGVVQNTYGITIKDGVPVYVGTQPELKDAIQFFHRLYDEGLLDQEIFTQSTTTYNAKVRANPSQIGVMTSWSNYTVNLNAGEGVYEYLEPLKSPNGESPVWQYRYTPICSNLAVWVTDKAEGKLPQILKFMDTFYDQKLGVEFKYGKFGQYIEEVSTGVYRLLTDAEGNDYGAEEKSKDVALGQSPYALLLESFKWETMAGADLASLKAMEYYANYLEPEPSYIDFWIAGEDSKELNILSTDIGAHYKQNLAKWIVEGGVETEWDDYVNAYEGLQLDRMIELMIKD